jgi:hypothetical protein
LRSANSTSRDLEDAGAVEGGDEVVFDFLDEEEGGLGEEVFAGEVVGGLQKNRRERRIVSTRKNEERRRRRRKRTT